MNRYTHPLLLLMFLAINSALLPAQPVDMLREVGFEIGSRSLPVLKTILAKGARIEKESLNNPEARYTVRNLNLFGIKTEYVVFFFNDDTLRRVAFFPINDYATAIIPFIRLHARIAGQYPPFVSKQKTSSSALYVSSVGSSEFGKAQFEFSLQDKTRRRVLIYAHGDKDPDEQDGGS